MNKEDKEKLDLLCIIKNDLKDNVDVLKSYSIKELRRMAEIVKHEADCNIFDLHDKVTIYIDDAPIGITFVTDIMCDRLFKTDRYGDMLFWRSSGYPKGGAGILTPIIKFWEQEDDEIVERFDLVNDIQREIRNVDFNLLSMEEIRKIHDSIIKD